ncbi:hypothetical protein LJC59_05140 [Desulfovibrio sp. OttesenSCG-928-A18]|nr:hypothetical protein [Desulfovibrio sp. OttesenSCG-928-A18]
MKFLFFSYTLPTKAAKARVQVWRQLKKIGAVSYRALWVVPYAKDRVATLDELGALVQSFQGESLLFEGKLLKEEDEKKVMEDLSESSRQEYNELLDICAAYLKEIEKEIAAENFIFAEVEENEEELDKIKNWVKKIQKREIVPLPERGQALAAVEECEKAFEHFSALAYERSSHTTHTA